MKRYREYAHLARNSSLDSRAYRDIYNRYYYSHM